MVIPFNPTLQDVKEVIGIPDTDVSKDGILTRLLFGALDLAERKTRRQFSTGVETRIFSGNDRGYLIVDDFQDGSITELSFLRADRTVWRTLTGTEYTTTRFRPQEPVAFRIDLVNNVSENPYRVVGLSPYVFPEAIANIRITANFGTWSVLPIGLENIVVDMVRNKFSRQPNIRSMSVGGESLSFSEYDLTDEMQRGLQEYKRPLVDLWPS